MPANLGVLLARIGLLSTHLCCAIPRRVLGFMSYTPEQLSTLQHVVQDMDGMRDRRLRELRPDDVLGEPEPDVVTVGAGGWGGAHVAVSQHHLPGSKRCFGWAGFC